MSRIIIYLLLALFLNSCNSNNSHEIKTADQETAYDTLIGIKSTHEILKMLYVTLLIEQIMVLNV